MWNAATLAFSQLFTKPFRAVFWKALGLTLVLFIMTFTGIQGIVDTFVAFTADWADWLAKIIAGFGTIVVFMFFIVPITTLLAGLFLDEVAEVVEDTYYAHEEPGRSMAFLPSLIQTLKFTALVVAVNLLALVALLIPGVNFIVFYVVNGYLLGREYFELAAMRFAHPREVKDLRRANGTVVFLGGAMIAIMMTIPILNLLTPLFATAFMVHLHKHVRGSRPRLAHQQEAYDE